MSRITGTNISFSSLLDGKDQFLAWKKTRSEYVRNLGRILLICSESDIVKIFDKWEAQIAELEKTDKGTNYLTALLTISLLHYFDRSYDQVKIHVPFVTKMLEHKSRTIICAAARVLRWLACELPDNIEFLRDLVANSAAKWLLAAPTRFAALQVLNAAGKFILPNVFAVTSTNLPILWSAVRSDDSELRVIAANVFDVHLRGIPQVSAVSSVEAVFRECMKIMANKEPSNHGCVLICGSIMRLYRDVIDLNELDNALLEQTSVKSEPLVFEAMNLLREIAQSLPHFFTPDTVTLVFKQLIAGCQRYPSSKRLLEMISKFMCAFNPLLVPVQMIIDFLRQVVKQRKYPMQQQLGFVILKKIFGRFKDATVQASFFLDADPSPAYMKALRKRMALFGDLKAALMKYYQEGIGPKATPSQLALSLHILKLFDQHLFKDKDVVYHQISGFTKSQSEEVRLLVAEVLPLFSNQEAIDDLLYLALLDESKFVRAAAVSQLKKQARLAHNDMLTQVLSDPSYKVKRNAIVLIASVAPLNPMLFHVPMVSFVQQVMLAVASSSNPCICARISTLLPLIAEHFLQFCPSFVPQVVHICFSFLGAGLKNETVREGKESEKTEVKISHVIHRDMSHDGHALISNNLPFDSSCTNLLRIFQIENQEYIEKRDANLFATLACLAEHLGPFLNDLVPLFVQVFSSVRCNTVYANALVALTQIVIKIPQAASIPSGHPNLVPVLMVLLRKKPSEDVAIKVLKLMGTLGVTSYPRSFVDDPTERDPMSDFDVKSNSFHTDFVMNLLLRLINEPHSSIFEAITSVFVKEADYAAKFLCSIINAFARALTTAKGQQKDTLFNQLEIIAYFSGAKIEPFVEIITPHILQNIGMTSAVRLASVLSYFLKTEFIPRVQELYKRAIRQVTEATDDLKYLETLLTFLSYAIIFQNQPVDVFIEQCNKTLKENVSADVVFLLVDALVTIVQLGDAAFECARITRLCIKLLKANASAYGKHDFELLYSLAVYARLSPDFIESVVANEGLTCPTLVLLRDYLTKKPNSDDSFLVHRSITVKVVRDCHIHRV